MRDPFLHATDYESLQEVLLNLDSLSKKSKLFLSSTDQKNFLKHFPADKMPQEPVAITSMTTMKKDRLNDDQATDILIVSDDQKNIYFLDCDAFTPVLVEQKLPDIPLFLTASGLFESNFFIYFIGRNSNQLHLIQRHKSSSRLNVTPIDLSLNNGTNTASFSILNMKLVNHGLSILTNKFLKLVTFENNQAQSQQVNLKLNSGLNFNPVLLEKLTLPSNLQVNVVGYNNGIVEFYSGINLVSTFNLAGSGPNGNLLGGISDGFGLQALKFLNYGRESNALISVHNSEVDVKILKRTAKLNKVGLTASIGKQVVEKIDSIIAETSGRHEKLNIKLPKNTQLYLEFLSQEEKYLNIHKEFAKVKLLAAENYLQGIG